MPPSFTPARAWAPLSDPEWDALAPYVWRDGAGRPLRDPRGRLDAVFKLVTSRLPWRDAARGAHSAGAVQRQFRRWAHAGLWERLVDLAADAAAPRVWRGLRYWLYRSFARAARLVGLRALLRMKRLGLWSALPGPPWMLPDPDLSETLKKLSFWALEQPGRARLRLIRLIRRALRGTGGRRIPRALRWGL